jgi:hypothetical protein
MAKAGEWCPVLKPTKQEFERPFVEYVASVFQQHPDLPMFKVRGPALIYPPGPAPQPLAAVGLGSACPGWVSELETRCNKRACVDHHQP